MNRSLIFSRFIAVLFLTCMMILASLMNAGSIHAEEDSPQPDNGLPVVYLNIDESQGTIEDMLASKDHSVYCYGTFSVSVPEGFHYSDFPDLACESFTDIAMSIRGRGNSTWGHDGKKPFKIKLDKKTDLFSLGKNKHWVLIANAMDETLLRDRISAWLGDRLGFEFTPRGVPVDVVMTGENYGTQYLGSYYLSENVRVDENRLEIDELEEDMTQLPEITGGYLLQNPTQLPDDSPERFKTSRGKEWATHTPSFDTSDDGYDNPAQQNYIQNHMQKIEDALYSDGTGYREYVDIESAAKYWLMNEISMNSDGYGTGSTYIYKKRDTEDAVGRLYWGPIWDFDYGWDRIFNESGFTAGDAWVMPMFTDREEGGFLAEVKKQWPVLKEAAEELIAEGGVIDRYYEETKLSAEQDEMIWKPDHEDFDYKKEVDELKDWIRKRLAWMDENFGLVDDLVHKVKYMDGEDLFAMEFKEAGGMIYGNEPHPEKEGYIFTGWADEEGNIIGYNTDVTRDMVLTAQFISEEEATHAEDIIFRRTSDVATYSYYVHQYLIDYEIIPADAIDKAVEWSVSDESFASVDENGTVTFNGPGEVTVYAKLKNGVVRELKLTVIQGDPPAPESVYPLEETVEMTVGQKKPFTIAAVPAEAKIHLYEYTSADESIVTVDDYGVMNAIAPGKTKVHVRALTNGETWGDFIVNETEITVIVTNGKPVPAEIVYSAVSGDKVSWRRGSDKEVIITVKRSVEDETCFSHFSDVLSDGTKLTKDKDYTAVSGSTVITLKAALLEKLADGEHTITVMFDDGKADVKLIIAAKEVQPSPDTSDHRDQNLPLAMALSLLIFTAAFTLRLKCADGRQ